MKTKEGNIMSTLTLFFMLSLAMLVFFGVLQFGVNYWFVKGEVENEMDSYRSSLLIGFDTFIQSGEEILKQVVALPLSRKICSADAINELKKIQFHRYIIQNISYQMENGMMCSSMLGETQDVLLGKVPLVEANGIRIWLHQLSRSSFLEQPYLILEQSGVRVSLHLQTLFSVHEYGYYVPYVGVQWVSQGHIIAFSEQATSSVMDTAQHPIWFTQSETSIPNISLVMALPSNPVTQKMVYQFFQHVWISVVVAFLFSVSIFFGVLRHRRSLLYRIRSGLREQKFYPTFQPIVDLKTNECVGAEMLSRWDGTPPDIFIPAMESSGLLPMLTRSAITQSILQLGPFLASRPDLYLSVNLSLSELMDGSFIYWLKDVLLQHHVQPKQLRLELTERQLLNKEQAIDILTKYRSLGFYIYVDDFGTGYSTLSYLKDLPLDVLKIDKSFIDSVDNDSVASLVTEHIIKMAQNLNLGVIAEGIEHHYQVEYLLQHGVHYGQGWLYSKALDANQWVDFVATSGVFAKRSGLCEASSLSPWHVNE